MHMFGITRSSAPASLRAGTPSMISATTRSTVALPLELFGVDDIPLQCGASTQVTRVNDGVLHLTHNTGMALAAKAPSLKVFSVVDIPGREADERPFTVEPDGNNRAQRCGNSEIRSPRYARC